MISRAGSSVRRPGASNLVCAAAIITSGFVDGVHVEEDADLPEVVLRARCRACRGPPPIRSRLPLLPPGRVRGYRYFSGKVAAAFSFRSFWQLWQASTRMIT